MEIGVAGLKQKFWRLVFAVGSFTMICWPGSAEPQWEQRDGVSHRRGPYNLALFYRHNETFMNGAAIHFAHAIQHDILELTPLSQPAVVIRQYIMQITDALLIGVRSDNRVDVSPDQHKIRLCLVLNRQYRLSSQVPDSVT